VPCGRVDVCFCEIFECKETLIGEFEDFRLGSAWRRGLGKKSHTIDQETALAKILEDLLTPAAKVSVELDCGDRTVQGVSHHSVIELPAHNVRHQLSHRIQQQQMNEIAAVGVHIHACPTCGTRCEVTPNSQQVTSTDGRLELPERVGFCHKCRRLLFTNCLRLGLDAREPTLLLVQRITVAAAESRTFNCPDDPPELAVVEMDDGPIHTRQP